MVYSIKLINICILYSNNKNNIILIRNKKLTINNFYYYLRFLYLKISHFY